MSPSDIKWLQVENTTRCNLWCPACARNVDGYTLIPELVLEDLDTERFKEILLLFPNLETIQFSGTYGDTIAAQNVLEHIELAKQFCKKIQIHTHGGIRNAVWWKEFAGILGDIDHDVWFALDGLKGTHEIYRQGSNFDKVLENAQSFIKHGGSATWQFIPWAHNEHQIKDCLRLSQQLGFKKFKLVTSVRKEFQGKHYRTGQTVEFFPWSRDNAVNKYNKSMAKHVQTSDCMHLSQPSVYINADGDLSHCCFYNTARSVKNFKDLNNMALELAQQPSHRCLKWCGSHSTIHT